MVEGGVFLDPAESTSEEKQRPQTDPGIAAELLTDKDVVEQLSF